MFSLSCLLNFDSEFIGDSIDFDRVSKEKVQPLVKRSKIIKNDRSSFVVNPELNLISNTEIEQSSGDNKQILKDLSSNKEESYKTNYNVSKKNNSYIKGESNNLIK